MNNDVKYRYDSNYNEASNFTRLKFGHDLPLLETELNEMQILQEKARTSLARRLVPSGFIELIQKEFNGSPIIYNPVINSMLCLNKIAIAPSRAIINGYELTVEGNFNANGYNNYLLIDLGDAPAKNSREDLIYLEMWFEVLTGNDNIKKYGYQNGDYIGYTMIDPRVNDETSRRIALCWNIRVAKDVNFSQFPNGFGYLNKNVFSPIRAIANGGLDNKIENENFLFANAGHDMFKECEFFKDNNLWVAGRPDYTIGATSTIYGKYIYALPLFKVKRRSKEMYSIEKFNGALSYNYQDNTSNSSTKDDLNNHIRPDKLYYDYIVPQDLIDLRRTISVKEFRSEYYLDKSIKELFTGKLQTKDTNQMRRVQFGNDELNYNDENIIFISRFNNTVASIIPGISNPAYSSVSTDFIYKDSVNGYGLLVDGKNSIKYDLRFVNNSKGTIDFFFQPYWHGPENVSQTILTIFDANDHAIFRFSKEGAKLIFAQHLDVNGVVNTAEVDLTNTILYAKNIYHVRLSWSNEDNINAAFIYVNGKLSGQSTYMSSNLMPNYMKIGALEPIPDNSGFVIENLIIYNKAFERNITTDTGSSIKNEFWPKLPNDFISGDALIYPSFNSILSEFSDNYRIQDNTMIEIDVNGGTSFLLKAPKGKLISSTTTPIVYDYEGNTIPGNWAGLDTDEAAFESIYDLDKVVVQFSLTIPAGNGGYDLPNEILSAGLLLDNKIKEISFNRMNSPTPRQINFYKPRRVNGMTDIAYDFATNRTDDKAYARLLYYYVGGNGTNQYSIPMTLYGYDVIGVVDITGKKLVRLDKVPDTQNPANGTFSVALADRVLFGEVIEFKLALGGMTFDYETQSKTLISNIHKTKNLQIVADGNNDTYVIPCFTQGGACDGILKSVFTFSENVFDTNKKVVGQIPHRTYYINNSMFIPIMPDDPRQPVTYKLATYQLDTVVNSFGTPFLRIKFDDKPKAGDVIEIPVLVSYQPSESEVISIWYNHIPYQGVLSNEPKKLKRISNWKYFLTTLGSGSTDVNVDEYNIYSLNNIINRLPGGLSYSYMVDGKPIKLVSMGSTANKEGIDTRLIFTNDVYYANGLDTLFSTIDTDFTVYKNAKGFQDGDVILDSKDFKLYFNDCVEAISKYAGAACLVMDENGEIMLFVLGYLDKNSSLTNQLKLSDGDLFRINGLPTTIQQY